MLYVMFRGRERVFAFSHFRVPTILQLVVAASKRRIVFILIFILKCLNNQLIILSIKQN